MCNKGQRSRLLLSAALPGVTPVCTGVSKQAAGSRAARKPVPKPAIPTSYNVELVSEKAGSSS